MIVIIADDFSGAAELAGIAAARGYKAEVQTAFDPSSNAEVIAVDTNTRMKSEREAESIVDTISKTIIASHPEWIYKKTDSVLRGHVRVEIEAILDATGQNDCLLIPANPSKGRVIVQGSYSIDGVPLNQTVFAKDPDFPRTSASVATLLGPTNRISIPDVAKDSAITPPSHASTLAAGGADFFIAILGNKEQPAPPIIADPGDRVLLVCGSLAGWETGRAKEMTARGFELFLSSNPPSPNVWHLTHRVMIASGPLGKKTPIETTEELIAAALTLAEDHSNLTIALEGGATAMAFISRMGWTRFDVLPHDHVGVGSLRPPQGPLLCVKPGSYPWPHSLF